jgi:hypothetical protein
VPAGVNGVATTATSPAATATLHAARPRIRGASSARNAAGAATSSPSAWGLDSDLAPHA